jgi:hypothetical protein
MKKLLAFQLFACFLFAVSCSSDDEKETTPATTDKNPTTTAEVLALYESIFYGADDIYIDPTNDDYIIIETSAFPDHKSPYFKGTQWEAEMYVQDTRPSFQQAPGNQVSVIDNYKFRIPVNPTEDASKTALPTATIGIAANGVPLYNQYAAANSPITTSSGEYLSFDLYGGHPTPNDEYHYHIEPNYITTAKGKDALIGYLLDGFPVYGPLEDGKTLVSANLDVYHGHEHATDEYPAGIYHYHITADSPYINGNGYFGNAGSWSK